MKILHYFLGFPPYRSGGLTKFATDLMCSQAKSGHFVSALWPGRMSFFSKKTKIRRGRPINGVVSYELINPMPVPLDEGIKNVEAFVKSMDAGLFERFFRTIAPEVIHIHTLMGLPKEMLELAHAMGIRVVFTAHDYFGLCPKVTLFRHGDVCADDDHCEACVECNNHALSLRKIAMLQSPLYRRLKDFSIFQKLRRIHRLKFEQGQSGCKPNILKKNKNRFEDYCKLRAYYMGMFAFVDVFHFNSSQTETIYRKFINPGLAKVISITHRNIADNRRCALNKKRAGKFRLTYLGPAKTFKGFFVIKQALNELWKQGWKNFELQLFCPVDHKEPYMECKNRKYEYSELERIFANTDVLLLPSLWYETFGFTILEALSYGVPVILSNRVGAKDIVSDGGIIVKADSVDDLKNAVLTIAENCDLFRSNVQQHCTVKPWNSFLKEMETLYRIKE